MFILSVTLLLQLIANRENMSQLDIIGCLAYIANVTTSGFIHMKSDKIIGGGVIPRSIRFVRG